MVKMTFWRPVRLMHVLATSIVSAIIFASGPALAGSHENARAGSRPITIVGHLENAAVVLHGLPDLTMKAKMDTGADMTSIHAVNIERYTKNGEAWVRFTVEAGGRSVVLRRRLVGTVGVRRAGTAVVERPVVRVGICIAGYYGLIQVNLTDRSTMSSPLLVGRRFMAPGRLAIDSAKTYLGSPVCPRAPERDRQ